MKFNLLKKSSELHLKTSSERKMYKYFDNLDVKKLGKVGEGNVKAEELQVSFFKTKKEIKQGLKDQLVVCIDCFKRSFLFYSKKNDIIYFLRIDFDLNEIFGCDVTEFMDIREERILGTEIKLVQAQEIIDNYLDWIEEEKTIQESGKNKEEKTTQNPKKEKSIIYNWLIK